MKDKLEKTSIKLNEIITSDEVHEEWYKAIAKEALALLDSIIAELDGEGLVEKVRFEAVKIWQDSNAQVGTVLNTEAIAKAVINAIKG